MYGDALKKLEANIRVRNQTLASLLKEGLEEWKVRRILERGHVKGAIDPIVAVYSWHDGTQGKPGITMDEVSLFPKVPYCLVGLEMTMIHFKGFDELASYHAPYANVAGRYFPIFWDGSTDFITVDLASSVGEVFILEDRSPALIRLAYPSFKFSDFLEDAIVANRENRALKCFL